MPHCQGAEGCAVVPIESTPPRTRESGTMGISDDVAAHAGCCLHAPTGPMGSAAEPMDNVDGAAAVDIGVARSPTWAIGMAIASGIAEVTPVATALLLPMGVGCSEVLLSCAIATRSMSSRAKFPVWGSTWSGSASVEALLPMRKSGLQESNSRGGGRAKEKGAKAQRATPPGTHQAHIGIIK